MNSPMLSELKILSFAWESKDKYYKCIQFGSNSSIACDTKKKQFCHASVSQILCLLMFSFVSLCYITLVAFLFRKN